MPAGSRRKKLEEEQGGKTLNERLTSKTESEL